jgi:hypothetical protein
MDDADQRVVGVGMTTLVLPYAESKYLDFKRKYGQMAETYMKCWKGTTMNQGYGLVLFNMGKLTHLGHSKERHLPAHSETLATPPPYDYPTVHFPTSPTHVKIYGDPWQPLQIPILTHINQPAPIPCITNNHNTCATS